VIRRSGLRWLGHVERKDLSDGVKKCANLVIGGKNRKGRPKKTWRSRVDDGMRKLKLAPIEALDRNEWRRKING